MSANNLQTNPNNLAPPMPDNLYNEAIRLFSIPSTVHNETSMAFYIAIELEDMNADGISLTYRVDDYSNIIVTKGQGPTYACFCAHLDTVHLYPNGFKLQYQKKDGRTYLFAADNEKKSVGIGGDDKCGIFACLYLLKRLDNIKVVFFSQEESGGTGSGHIELSFFDDCRFIGGIDRWNGHDFINQYSGERTISKAFSKLLTPILKKYDYTYTSGMFTDSFNVMEREVNISCFNLSCGYYSHHSSTEYVDLNELYNACLIAAEIALLPDRYYHKYDKVKFDISTNYYGDNWATDSNYWKSKKYQFDYQKPTSTSKFKDKDGIRYCDCCGLELLNYENKYCTTCDAFMRPQDDDMSVIRNGKRVCLDCGIVLFSNEKTYCGICKSMSKKATPEDIFR